MDLPILYSFRRCPYAMRARMALLISNCVCEIREVQLRSKPEPMIEASPKATVPVLVLPGGQVIEESLEIMRWSLRLHDPEGWLQGDDNALIAANDGAFKHHLDRYKYAGRHQTDPNEHREACMEILQVLEERLKEQAYLCGEHRSIADMALMPFVRQFAETDRAWFDAQPIVAVKRWLSIHLASPIFERTMVKLKPWTAGDPPTLFPEAT